MQQINFINVILARHVSGMYAYHQEHWMLSCSIRFSALSFWMGGGLESRCVGRVYGADVAVARQHPHRTHDLRSCSQDNSSLLSSGCRRKEYSAILRGQPWHTPQRIGFGPWEWPLICTAEVAPSYKFLIRLMMGGGDWGHKCGEWWIYSYGQFCQRHFWSRVWVYIAGCSCTRHVRWRLVLLLQRRGWSFQALHSIVWSWDAVPSWGGADVLGYVPQYYSRCLEGLLGGGR